MSRVFAILILLLCCNPKTFTRLYDCYHYTDIANNGYYHEGLTAFFPMIPLLIRLLSVHGVIIINQLCVLFSMVLLDKIMETNTVEMKNRKVVLFMFTTSPLLVFSIVPYTESLFVFLTILAFYLFTKRDISWKMGIVMGLCVFTRNLGACLFFAIFIGCVVLWMKKQTTFKQIVCAYGPATVISLLYPIYLQITFGNWKSFMDVQETYWWRHPSNLISTCINNLYTLVFAENIYESSVVAFGQRLNEFYTLLYGLPILIFGVMFLVKHKFKTDEIVCYTYTLLSILCITASVRYTEFGSPTVSFYRYFAAIFAIYLAFGSLKNTKILNVVASVNVILTMIASLCFYSDFTLF